MLGEKLTPLLLEIEAAIIEHDAGKCEKPNYGDAGFRAAAEIFMSAMSDKSYELMEREGLSMEDRLKMIGSCGTAIHDLIKTYTGIDTFEFYK